MSEYLTNLLIDGAGASSNWELNSDGRTSEDINQTASQVMTPAEDEESISANFSASKPGNQHVSVFDSKFGSILNGSDIPAKYIATPTNFTLNTSYSGADTKVSFAFKDAPPVYVGEAQTVTYSLYRPTNPVYRLGSASASGFVRGQRTVAGSVIFTVFDRNVILNAFYNAYRGIDSTFIQKEYLTDELPPFDIHLTFLNEYGIASVLVIHNVQITSEGQVMSIEDLITENTMQYLATDMTMMYPGVI